MTVDSGSRSLHVLVADDDPINRMIATAMLRKRGHTTTSVENGREAVDAVSDGKFDVVLMDVNMPEMDGPAAMAVIREREKATGGRLRMIALTAELKASDRAACFAAGADDCLAKPLVAEDLFTAIEAATG